MAVQNVQLMYLDEDVADVWFLIDGERIPACKTILAAKSEYYKTMFYGSMPEADEINMNEANISVESFKEFLKLIYLVKPNLTMDNIEGVINMAKISLSDELFSKCEDYLKTLVTIDTTFVFRLALFYDAKNFIDAICWNAESIFKTSSFLELPFEHLQMIIQHDSLVCEEKDIFIAFIDWAKAACIRNNFDPLNVENLRNQLRDSVYQIRFTTMTKEEASVCIALYPGLFTANELQEIICMVGHNDTYQPKVFNWIPRRFNLNYNNERQLQCSRFCGNYCCLDCCEGTLCCLYFMKKRMRITENTRFTCNQRVLLLGFSSVLNVSMQPHINAQINEINSNGDISELYSEHLTACYNFNPNIRVYEAKIPLNKAILIRPNHTYEICITIEENSRIHNHFTYSKLKCKVRVDHDIVFHFDQDGAVSGLSFSRFNDKNYLQKIMCDPIVWCLAALMCHSIFIRWGGKYLPYSTRLIINSLATPLDLYAYIKVVAPKIYKLCKKICPPNRI